ncbi:MAG: protein kinase [Nitrospinota bacterium]|nr:protein kinase [Nitrospinota bacterium]
MSTVQLRKLGRFEILGEIGSGGMGVVYKGRDPKINRLVALKVIRTFFGSSRKKDEVQSLERFYLEAQAAGSLSHQNIVTIYDVGEDDTAEGNIVYIAMEFLDGKGLDHYIDNDGFPTLREKIQIVKQISAGLDYAHKREVIHRDVKPGNIIITERNDPKLTDFGLARFSDASMTMSGTILGTPNYMSPEQVQGKKVDARSDFFALSVIFYEMLTGIKPFAGETITTVIYKVVNEEPEPPSRIDPSLPKTVDQFLKKGLAKNPADRFQTGLEYIEALDQLLTGSFTIEKDTPFDPDATIIVKRSELSYKLESVYNRHKSKILAGGGAMAVLLLFLGLYSLMGSTKEPTGIKGAPVASISVGNLTGKPIVPPPPPPAVVTPPDATTTSPPVAATTPPPPPAVVTTPTVAPPRAKPVIPKEPQLLTVKTDPSNAEVFIGTKFLGTTPMNKYEHKSGEFELVIKRSGYADYKKKILLNKELVLDDIKLTKLQVAPTTTTSPPPPPAAKNVGVLKITVPSGSESLIYVDGKEYKEGSLTLSDLSPGSHIVYIQIKGRTPYTSRVKIKAGATTSIDCASAKQCK